MLPATTTQNQALVHCFVLRALTQQDLWFPLTTDNEGRSAPIIHLEGNLSFSNHEHNKTTNLP